MSDVKAQKHGTSRIASKEGKPFTHTEKSTMNDDKRALDVNIIGVEDTAKIFNSMTRCLDSILEEIKLMNEKIDEIMGES